MLVSSEIAGGAVSRFSRLDLAAAVPVILAGALCLAMPIISVRMTDLSGGFRVSEAAEVSVLMDQIEGCVTAIEPVGDHRALVGVFIWCIWCADPDGASSLLLIHLSGVR